MALVEKDVRSQDHGGWKARHGLLAPALDAFQAALILLAVVLFLRCQGPPYWWVLLATAVPGLRFAIAPSYRCRMLDEFHQLWAELEAFPEHTLSIPWRAVMTLVVLPAGILFQLQREHVMTGDTKPVTLTATALVRQGHCELSGFIPGYREEDQAFIVPLTGLPYFITSTPRGCYSSYPSGMVPFALPSTAVAHWLGADLDRHRTQGHLEKGVASWVAAACVGLFFLLARHLADARAAWLVAILLATGSAVYSTVAQALWQQGGVILWLLVALLVEFRTWRRPSPASVVIQGLALAMMFSCRSSAALLILAFGLWLLLRAPRRAVAVGCCAALAYLPWAAFYRSVYATPLGPSAIQCDGSLWCWPSLRVLAYLLFSPDHGLLAYQPWILLGVVGCFWPAPPAPELRPASAAPHGWSVFCLAAITLHLSLLCCWICWWGGDCWGSRLATEIVPLCGLLCVRPIARAWPSTGGRRLVYALAMLSCFLHAAGIYLKADYRDNQPGLFSRRPEPPGSWQHAPFLTPFLGAAR